MRPMDDTEMVAMAETCWHFDLPWPMTEREERLRRRTLFFSGRLLDMRLREFGREILAIFTRP